MVLLLTVLTWIAAAILLVVLGWALLQIRRTLESTAKSLDKIAMGVRAIDTETAPLPNHLDRVNNSLPPLVPGLQAVHTHLTSVDDKLGTIAKVLGR